MGHLIPSLTRALCLMVLACMLTLPVAQAFAQPAPATTTGTASAASDKGSEVCTDFQKLRQKAQDEKTPGLLTSISNMIKDVIMKASKSLYEAFIKNSAYTKAVGAAMTLMVAIYGAAFLMGVVQPSFGQALIKLIRIGLILALISPSGWEFFSQYVVKFFNDGTDYIIGSVIEIGTGSKYTVGDSPFKQLDTLAKWVISPDMVIALIGTITARGPYGLSMGFLMAFAFGSVVKLLIEALKLYAITFILRALLLGLAPIFIVFLLFDKTRGLFMGWLNSLINLSLQPILFFTFLSFFVVMIVGASQDMLGHGNGSTSGVASALTGGGSSSGTSQGAQNKGIEFCWREYKELAGAQNKISGWVMKVDGKVQGGDAGWQGAVKCLYTDKKDNPDCKDFPINIMDLLSFLILVYVATRFSGVVDNLAGEISNVMINTDVHSKDLYAQAKRGGGEEGGQSKNAGGASPPMTGRR